MKATEPFSWFYFALERNFYGHKKLCIIKIWKREIILKRLAATDSFLFCFVSHVILKKWTKFGRSIFIIFQEILVGQFDQPVNTGYNRFTPSPRVLLGSNFICTGSSKFPWCMIKLNLKAGYEKYLQVYRLFQHPCCLVNSLTTWSSVRQGKSRSSGFNSQIFGVFLLQVYFNGDEDVWRSHAVGMEDSLSALQTKWGGV